jgi:hypothetical protein
MNMPDDVVPEPQGASTAMGFVKTRPENNDVYVSRWQFDPWYPAIEYAHRELSRLIPGYNIAQIKEKFGGLRYYFDFPEEIAVGEDREHYTWLGTVEAIRQEAQNIVRNAEFMAEGISIGRKQVLEP